MRRFTTEFKVGLFLIVGIVLFVGAWMWSYDGVRADEDSYVIDVVVESADGLWVGTDVRLAGVEIGAVEAIEVHAKGAKLTLRIRAQYQLPVDTLAELKATGLLGDYYVRVYPGTADAYLQDGGRVEIRSQPGDIDKITRQVERITEDVAAITDVVRQIVENGDNRDHLEATLANVDQLTEQLALIARQNAADIDAITDSVRRLTDSLEGYTNDIAADVDEEMELLKETTATLQEALEDIESITGKVNRGEGTLGALVNDRETIDAINDTIENANTVIESFSGLRAEVYYTGRYFLGSQPNDPSQFFDGQNPLHNSASNTLGIRLKPHEDFWWIFEVNDYPTGTLRNKVTYYPETGEIDERWIQELNYRFTFQMMKRWGNLGLRLGVKENGGGLGATYWVMKDRLRFDVDVFDFAFGSYPALEASGTPNMRVGTRFEPIKNLYLEAGAEQVLLGARYGYGTGYFGGGFYFTDDDIKLLLASLPLGF